MSEAKDLNSSSQEPEIFSEKFPSPAEARVVSAQAVTGARSISSQSRFENDDSQHQPSSIFEKTANLMLKITLLITFAFTAGAGLTVMILMDLLDHKSGWLKQLLQFIKETSKIFTK